MTEETQAAQANPLDEFVKAGYEEEVLTEQPAEATQVEQSQAESAPAEVEANQVDGEPLDSPPESDGIQKRINKLTAEKHAEKRNNEALRKELEELKRKIEPSAPTEQPTLESFDYDEQKYQDALVEWRVEQRLKADREEAERQAAQAELQKVHQTFSERQEAFAKQAPDYQEVIQGLPELPQDVFEAILLAEEGPKLAYHLANNLDIVDALQADAPAVRLLRLGQISASLKAVSEPAITPTVKTSAAPEPIKPVSSGGSSSKELEDMSMEELMKM